MTDINLILGSSSPRRIEMMKEHGFAPVIIKPEAEENLPADIGMEDAVMLLSLKKALAVEESLRKDTALLAKACFSNVPWDTSVAKPCPNYNGSTYDFNGNHNCNDNACNRHHRSATNGSGTNGSGDDDCTCNRHHSSGPNVSGADDCACNRTHDCARNTADLHPYIVTADTVVYYGNIIGKPQTREEAFQILSMLKGKTHFVATGVTILKAFSNVRRCFYEVSSVEFTDFSDGDLAAYVDTDEPYDKAGGYAIQGAFKKYIKGYSGDYDNIVGFPWATFEKEFSHIIGL